VNQRNTLERVSYLPRYFLVKFSPRFSLGRYNDFVATITSKVHDVENLTEINCYLYVILSGKYRRKYTGYL
jgi:hypothetical protein